MDEKFPIEFQELNWDADFRRYPQIIIILALFIYAPQAH